MEGSADVIAEGRSLFNQYCAHCHGPNAIQGERPLDLRRLTLRYGRQATQVERERKSTRLNSRDLGISYAVLSVEKNRRIFIYLQTEYLGSLQSVTERQ